ncbi:MAG: hypothetical protein ABR611_10455 [Chthoniobacterales bacterium]
MSEKTPLKNRFSKRIRSRRSSIPFKNGNARRFILGGKKRNYICVREECLRIVRSDALRKRQQCRAQDFAAFGAAISTVLGRRVLARHRPVTAGHLHFRGAMYGSRRAVIRNGKPSSSADQRDWKTDQAIAQQVHRGIRLVARQVGMFNFRVRPQTKSRLTIGASI